MQTKNKNQSPSNWIQKITLAVSIIFLCVCCGGLSTQASEDWENICKDAAGQNIYRTVDDVDGYAFQLVQKEINLDTGQTSEHIAAQRLGYLFHDSKGKKPYEFVEFDLTPQTLGDGFWPVDREVVPGHYRAELQGLDSPKCNAAKKLPIGAGLQISDDKCIYAFKTDDKPTHYLAKETVTTYHRHSDHDTVYTAEWVVTDTDTGEILAKSKIGHVSWSHLTAGSILFPLTTRSGGEGKICPEGAHDFDITDVLKPK